MSEDDARSRQRLGQQQLHRAAVDLAGNRPSGAPNGPQTEDDLHQGMDIADRQNILSFFKIELVAADDALNNPPGPFKDLLLEIFNRSLFVLSHDLQEWRELRCNP